MWTLKLIFVFVSLAVTTGEMFPGEPVQPAIMPYMKGVSRPDDLCREYLKDKDAHMVKDDALVGDVICIVPLPCENSVGEVTELPGTPQDNIICDQNRICRDGRCESWLVTLPD